MRFNTHKLDDFAYLTAPNINTPHMFTQRHGPENNGSLSGDTMQMICRVIAGSYDNLISSKQVHGAYVRVITDTGRAGGQPSVLLQDSEADAMITNVKKTALMVLTADCLPILLYDPVQGAAGAVHAGWRGTALNISAHTVNKMESEFNCSPSNIHAAIGPGISKCCFETDKDAFDQIYEGLRSAAGHRAADTCITGQGSKYLIDLKEANRIMLIAQGLRSIAISGDCTVCMHDRYWSHRKHARKRGSQAAVIIPN